VKRRTDDGTAFELHGPAGAPVLVLVHGLGLTRATWEGHLPALAERHRVLAYDLAGHGESAPPAARPSLTLFSEQLRALMDALGIARAAVSGFSLGGMINRRFAMDHPGRCGPLVILNSPHERDPEAQRLVEERAAATEAGGPAATIDATIARWFTPGFVAARPDLIARVKAWVLANDPATYAACRQVLATGVTELIRPDPPIAHPALVITCENDTGSTPAMTRAIAAEIPGAAALIVPGLQHMGLMERPGLFTAPTLDFLAAQRW
jgi:pimeloyl-ACP methyl ester carboxylesterase